MPAPGVVAQLVADDPDAAIRQVGVVDARGVAASHAGATCPDDAGSVTGDCFAAQGNTLASSEVVPAMAATFAETAGAVLADRLLPCLDAAEAAGGDRRGQQAAALLVVQRGAGYGGSDRLVDLRVDDHGAPLAELRRLYELWRSA